MIKSEIVWICEAPSHYNDFLFNKLAEELKDTFEVNYMHGAISSHPWKKSFPRKYPNRVYKKSFGIDWILVKKALTSGRSTVYIIGGWFDLTAVSLIIILFLTGGKFIIWTDTPDNVKSRSLFYGFLRKLWLKFVFSHSCFVMGTGKRALEILELVGCPKKKLVNLPYFTRNDLFYPAPKQTENEEIVFLSSGRLVNSHKGHDVALRALGVIKTHLPNFKFKYRIAGVGEDKTNLELLADELGIKRHVEFVGWVEIDDLAEFYRTGDIFLHPSLYEPYGVAVIEAMASGLLVIATSTTGAVEDRIVDGCNGKIHRQSDHNQLAEIIISVITNPSLLLDMKIQARKTAEEWPLEEGVETIKKTLKLCAGYQV